MKRIIVLLGLLATTIFLASCTEEPPAMVEGQAELHLMALGDTALVDTLPTVIPLANAKVILSSEYGKMIKYADNNGVLKLTDIPSSIYDIAVRQNHPLNKNILLAGNLSDVKIYSGEIISDTILAEQISNTGIAINEIYCAGPVNQQFYFYDQFIEIYNYSDEVKYMDGWMIMRVSGNRSLDDGTELKGPGADEHDDGDIDGVIYVFKFPGQPGDQNIPIAPGEFIVMASDAIDHRNSVEGSIDLRGADWEFYNQFSPIDIDNPHVANLINMRSDKTVDFMISLASDVIILSDGRDAVWEDGIDIETILDGVEYQGGPKSKVTLDARVDKSYALSPPKYSGQSMQRNEPGIDTNDGILDWTIIPVPTPGYH